MALLDYCDYDEVRSALGVNVTELGDQVLALPVYEMGLVRELSRLSSAVNGAFSTIRLKTPTSMTTAEADLYNSVRLFSVYAVAKQVGVSLANFAPKDVGDGKASISRYAGEPFEKVLARVEEMYALLRTELRTAYEAFSGASSGVTPSTTPTTFFARVARVYDPVIGA